MLPGQKITCFTRSGQRFVPATSMWWEVGGGRWLISEENIYYDQTVSRGLARSRLSVPAWVYLECGSSHVMEQSLLHGYRHKLAIVHRFG